MGWDKMGWDGMGWDGIRSDESVSWWHASEACVGPHTRVLGGVGASSRRASWPQLTSPSPAAARVMNPKQTSLPRISVSTGAAKARNPLGDTPDCTSDARSDALASRAARPRRRLTPRPPLGTRRRRAASTSAAVPSHCATSVATAAPATPSLRPHTHSRSPSALAVDETAMATSGVTESLAPSRAACSTFPSRAAGSERRRMRTYDTDWPTSATFFAASAPTYSLSRGGAAAQSPAAVTTPQRSESRAARRTTASLELEAPAESSSGLAPPADA